MCNTSKKTRATPDLLLKHPDKTFATSSKIDETLKTSCIAIVTCATPRSTLETSR
jgi:hypothetical protein